MLGLRLGPRLSIRSGEAEEEFSPAALFSGGVAGAWYDPSDLSSMWQDSAGTTPAAVDSPVGRVNDKSGNGNHLIQATAGKRPMLRSSAGLYWLEFDGVDDFLAVAFTMPQPFERIGAYRTISYVSNTALVGGAAANNCLLLNYLNSPELSLFAGGSVSPTNTEQVVGTSFVASEIYNSAASSLAVNNGAAVVGNPGVGNPGGLAIASSTSAGAAHANMRFYGLLTKPSLTVAERTSLRAYMAVKAGVTL